MSVGNCGQNAHVSISPDLPGVSALAIPRRSPQAGRLLVASPVLTEETFETTVIALLEHDANGSLGVVLNRPTIVPVGDVLPGWECVGDDTLFQGGPVGLDSALAVGVTRGTVRHHAFRAVRPGWGLIDLDADPIDVAHDFGAIRVYAGYAGWSAGQLEDEVSDGAWYVVESTAEDLCADPDSLWSVVVRRQRNELRLLTYRTEEPEMN